MMVSCSRCFFTLQQREQETIDRGNVFRFAVPIFVSLSKTPGEQRNEKQCAFSKRELLKTLICKEDNAINFVKNTGSIIQNRR